MNNVSFKWTQVIVEIENKRQLCMQLYKHVVCKYSAEEKVLEYDFCSWLVINDKIQPSKFTNHMVYVEYLVLMSQIV